MTDELPEPSVLETYLIGLEVALTDWTPEMLAAAVLQCRDAKRVLSDIEHTFEDALVAALTEKRTELEGMVLEVRGGTKRTKWRPDELMPYVFRGLIDPEQTGELPDAGEIVERLRVGLPDIVPMTPSTGFKVTALKPLLARFGREIDEFAETTAARKTVQITRSEQT